MNNDNNIFNRQAEEDFNIKDFLFICLSKWHWFLISVIICVGVAMYKISKTHPTYTRYTDILIKSGEDGMSAQMERFASLGTSRGGTTIFNEIYALQSPAVIYEVVRRLNLDMSYEGEGTFHNHVLYGTDLPIKATIV
ncbi:MAG: chromosome partitioning protein ParA, partial [Bacteroidaceae bacterium]|nr:chromosome partitioning protein ParA [Bacteroidaceae bacterium]